MSYITTSSARLFSADRYANIEKTEESESFPEKNLFFVGTIHPFSYRLSLAILGEDSNWKTIKPATDRSNSERKTIKSVADRSNSEWKIIKPATGRSNFKRKIIKPATDRNNSEWKIIKPATGRSNSERKMIKLAADRSNPNRKIIKPAAGRSNSGQNYISNIFYKININFFGEYFISLRRKERTEPIRKISKQHNIRFVTRLFYFIFNFFKTN